jgi:1-acyl-sn-glycerol-3-phosphate acyltransferase
LLYRLLKIPASIALRMYCRELRVNKEAYFNASGPLLIACNHPNSFLDAIIISSLFKQPVYSLARGDAFKNKWTGRLLRSLNMLPVYRTSEGVENMEHNYTTFEACKKIFKKKGIVLIFSEGRCINEWHFRPLKKGTARLAISSWNDGINLTVLPAGINYHSFSVFGKNVHLNFGNPVNQNDIDLENGFGKSVLAFNQQLQQKMQPLIYEIQNSDIATQKKTFEVHLSPVKKTLLKIPSMLGYLLHLPLHFFTKKMMRLYGRRNDHYDSIIVGIVFLSYPLYLFFIAMACYLLAGNFWWLLTFILFPFLGWCYLLLKKQFP